MSPVSRGRKAKKGRASAGARNVPGLSGVHSEMVRAFQPLAAEGDPLDVEIFASGLVGAWWKSLPPGDDPDAILGLSAVEFAVRRGTPAALALLRAFAVVGAAPDLRQAAAAGAAALVERGVADPPWAAQIGRVQGGDCWRLADVYGDQASLYCEFSYDADRHALLVLLDFSHLGGWVKDVWITDQPDEVLTGLREQAAEQADMAVLDRIDPAVARRMIEDGFAATDATWQPGVAQTFGEYRAVALARCRALPEPTAPPPEPVEVSELERAALVEEFIASREAKALPDTPTTRYCVRLIVDFGADHDNGRLLRISPVKVETFLHDWLPREVILDESERDAMPMVVVAWTRWAARHSQLPDPAFEEVLEVAQECAGHFGEEYDDPHNASIGRLYLTGVDLDDPADLQAVLDRRTFAMPYVGTRIGDEDYPRLNPADPDERGILIEGEHPEWHDLLRDPSFEGEVDGVNPRLHLAMHEIVANQLWDDDPPEAWEAAQRLLAAGADRHDVLHQLGGVAMEHVYTALTAGEPADPTAYSKALDALGRAKAGGPRRAARPRPRGGRRPR